MDCGIWPSSTRRAPSRSAHTGLRAALPPALLTAAMLVLPYAAALPLCQCWRVSRSWPAAAHLRSAAASACLFRPAPHAPLQSRLPWSARERACSGGARRTLSVFSAARAGAFVRRRLLRAPWSDCTSPLNPAGVGRSGVTHGAVGSLHLIIGPMFAGKTTALLHMVQEHEARGTRPHAGWLHSSRGRSGRRGAGRTWWWSSQTVMGATPRERWSATTACGGCGARQRGGSSPLTTPHARAAAMLGAASACFVARTLDNR